MSVRFSVARPTWDSVTAVSRAGRIVQLADGNAIYFLLREADGINFQAYPARIAAGLIKDVFYTYNRTAEQFNNAVNTWRLIGASAFQNTFIFAEGESFPDIEALYYIVHPDVSEDGYTTYYCVPCRAESCW